MIECSNKKSIRFDERVSGKRTQANGSWENECDIDLNVGDQINLEHGIINVTGISSDGTVEIDAVDQDNGLSDSKVGMRFTAYVNDNGYNTVNLPLVGFEENCKYPLRYGTNVYPALDNLQVKQGETWNDFYVKPMKTHTDNTDGIAPFNAGEPRATNETDLFGIISNMNFEFTYGDWDGMLNGYGSNLKTYYTQPASEGSLNTISGKKYTLLEEGYLGPFRKDDQGNFNTEDEELKPMYLDLKIDLGRPLYESPSTIADVINQELNQTDSFGDGNNITHYVDDRDQVNKLPALTGPLLKLRKVNGYVNDARDYGPSQKIKLWANVAVLDWKKWAGIHALMRTDLAFNYEFSFNSGKSADVKKLYQPCFLMPQGNVNNQVYYPRIGKEFEWGYVKRGGDFGGPSGKKEETMYYADLQQYQLMTTNMKYNEANIKRIQTYMRNTEKYDGTYEDKDDQDGDIDNWRSHWDIGFSHHSDFGQHGGTRPLYYCGQGNFDLTKSVQPDKGDTSQYGYSFPYHPYESEIDVLSTSRSDIPDIGYTQMVVSDEDASDDDGHGISGLLVIQAIFKNVPHRFKDNKNKNAAMALYSRYDSSWRDKVKTDILDTTYFRIEDDDSLSKQYNVGVYPITMRPTKAAPFWFDLTNTYWKGYCNSLPEPIAALKYDFLFKITKGSDDDHLNNGGYSFWRYSGPQYDDPSQVWEELPDMYVYTANNMPDPDNMPDGRDPLTDLVFDGNYPLNDMAEKGYNWVVFDYANDHRFAALLHDEGESSGSMSMYYCEPGFNVTDPPYFPDDPPYHNFHPLGEANFEMGGHYYDVQITDMYITSTDPTDPYYDVDAVSGGANNKKAPKVQNPDNPEEIICGFLLYRDSITHNLDGSYDISEDFALPNIHQAQFCCSASFMDNEAVWLTNSSRYDKGTDQPGDQTLNINYIAVGANNPTFSYDNGVSRCTFTNLHIPKTLGADDMPTKDGNIVTTTIGNLAVKIGDNRIKNKYLFAMLDKYDSSGEDNKGTIDGDGETINYLLNYSISGISIHSLFGEPQEENNTDLDDMVLLDSDNWYGGLLSKLGFEYEDLVPRFGVPDVMYDESIMGSTDPSFRYKRLKDLTTNPLIDVSSANKLPVKDFTADDSAGAGLPTYSLSVGSSQIPTNLDGSVSEKIVASNLPIKNNDAYFTVYCSLSTGGYFSNRSEYGIIGLITKRFVEGDYIFSETQNPITVDIKKKISSIKIEIRKSDGTIAALNDDNTLVFKIIQRLLEEPSKK